MRSGLRGHPFRGLSSVARRTLYKPHGHSSRMIRGHNVLERGQTGFLMVARDKTVQKSVGRFWNSKDRVKISQIFQRSLRFFGVFSKILAAVYDFLRLIDYRRFVTWVPEPKNNKNRFKF